MSALRYLWAQFESDPMAGSVLVVLWVAFVIGWFLGIVRLEELREDEDAGR